MNVPLDRALSRFPTSRTPVSSFKRSPNVAGYSGTVIGVVVLSPSKFRACNSSPMRKCGGTGIGDLVSLGGSVMGSECPSALTLTDDDGLSMHAVLPRPCFVGSIERGMEYRNSTTSGAHVSAPHLLMLTPIASFGTLKVGVQATERRQYVMHYSPSAPL